MLYYISVIFLLTWGPTYIETLDCFNCKNITDPQTCSLTTSCATGQSCYLQTRLSSPIMTFDMGCQVNQQCNIAGAGGIVGRSAYKRQQVVNCHECCSSNGCNELLCAHRKPAACIDDDNLDCAHLDSLLNVCADVHHAKTICPKYCGLCNLVDGNWADWSSWLSCDVTCNNGTQMRLRTCTNPAPQNSGLDCHGENNQTRSCVNQLCPVHGGWTRWSGWSSCSVTCDTGLSKRTRSCTNPKPDRFGDNCFGDSQDLRMCFQQPCTNGSWSSWTQWSDCSVPCGLGESFRNRSCDSPAPSMNGYPCVGNDYQSEPCRNTTCEMVLFNFYGYSMNDTLMRFTSKVENIGDAYDSSTGYFTAPLPGSYFFSYQICYYTSQYYFYLYKANINLGSKEMIGSSKHYSYNQYDCSSTTIVTHMNEGDRVWVECSSASPSSINGGYRTMFSGGLLAIES